MADAPSRHDDHDLAAIVAFVDGEADATETAAATTQLVDCDACARLADDLRVLASADRDLATPARPRDFRLTGADIARLTSVDAEPSAAGARLVGEMTDTRSTHAAHDLALIAASIDDALTADEQRSADRLLAACTSCAELRADFIAIAAANRELPTPPRPRDFRLTERDVARVGMARWRHLLAWIGGSRDGITRPLATGLTTLGLVGVLITGMPALSLGSASSAAPRADPVGAGIEKSGDAGAQGAEGATGSVPGAVDAGPIAAPEGTDPDRINAAASASGENQQLTMNDQSSDGQGLRDAARPQPPVGLLASLVALVIGVLIFVARRATRPLRSV